MSRIKYAIIAEIKCLSIRHERGLFKGVNGKMLTLVAAWLSTQEQREPDVLFYFQSKHFNSLFAVSKSKHTNTCINPIILINKYNLKLGNK